MMGGWTMAVSQDTEDAWDELALDYVAGRTKEPPPDHEVLRPFGPIQVNLTLTEPTDIPVVYRALCGALGPGTQDTMEEGAGI